ncbi:MAG: ornithine cyclodeaminase family protein [Candidatus Bathyarchaeota archaeon]|nr:ornithine cyclodeaminase family protein [Candidatus Bathyarchaeota archaeon]
MVLFISDQDIARIEVTPEEVIQAVEGVYNQDGRGLAYDTPRHEARIKGKNLPHIAPGTTSVGQGMAYLEETGVVVLSHSFHFDQNWYCNHLVDPKDGSIIAIIKRSRSPLGERTRGVKTGNLRTGAAAAIGAKYLARKHIDEVGVIGTGRIGGASLLCLSKVRDFDRVYVHSGRSRDKVFASDIGRMLGVDVTAAKTVEQVVTSADVLITATYATEPIVKGEWLRAGVHISGMGADGPMKAELDAEAVRRADKIVIDGEKCLKIKEIADPIRQGIIRLDDIYGRIGKVVAGMKPGREGDSEITFFESDGTHMQSAGVAYLLYEKVKEAGLGVEKDDQKSFSLNL